MKIEMKIFAKKRKTSNTFIKNNSQLLIYNYFSLYINFKNEFILNAKLKIIIK